MNIVEKIAGELNIKLSQATSAVEMLDEGSTVPFISRYRKEATGGLDDSQLRLLDERLGYLRELEARKETILKSIKEQEKLTPEVEKSIIESDNKTQLEDIYLPYKPKRRTKAQIAKEAGLEELSNKLLNDPSLDPEKTAEQYLNKEKNILTAKDALDGARHILMESFAENSDLVSFFREYLWNNAILKCEVQKDKEAIGAKFKDYFDYQEPVNKIPSHRALAVMRGQNEEILRYSLQLEEDIEFQCLQRIANTFNIQDKKRLADSWLLKVVQTTWKIKFYLKLELELISRLRDIAETEAINVFANNLKNLLMGAPAGSRTTLGLDPGIRTGVKVVVVDGTGKLLEHTVVYPHQPRNDWHGSIEVLNKLCVKHKVELVSIGNGTASRETDKLVNELKKLSPTLNLTSIMISEAGASVYSASELASKEFPDLDVSFRGAVSIARRLQDPLAELVKIEPKAIGVGQYQHDVNQVKLSKSLNNVMEDCVNAVGVNVNTASAPLLSCIAGLNERVANNIIEFRDKNGGFTTRSQLKKVPRLGDKAFEQAAGFLRIVDGKNPLDSSSVHPEAYSIVEKILKEKQKSIKEILGDAVFLKSLNAQDYTDENFGIPTVKDILSELDKPGLDPRPEFKTAKFKDGIETIKDLKAGLILEGVVTNVANFGAFVDIGVHQDGLVHKSLLANHFVKDPNDFVKVGQIVKVKVLEVDLNRKRIQLSMKLTEAASAKPGHNAAPKHKIKKDKELSNSSLGDALMAAYKK